MPKPSLKSRIVVVDPAPGQARSLGRAHAERYVRQGRARWVDATHLRFLTTDHRHQSAQRLFRVQTAAGYDARGMLTVEEIRRLPVTQDAMKLLVGKRCA